MQSLNHHPESPGRSSILNLGLSSPELRLPKSPEVNGADQLAEVLGNVNIRDQTEVLREREDDDDDIDRLNIDEVDQARIEGLDNNLAVDEDFQHSLNERANQFTAGSEGNSINTTSFPSIPKPKVAFEYNDDFDLSSEISEWFTQRELKQLPLFKRSYKNYTSTSDFNELDDIKKSALVNILGERLTHRDTSLSALLCLVFISLGSYGHQDSIERHTDFIKKNNMYLASKNIVPGLIKLLERSFHNIQDRKQNIAQQSQSLFLTSTILYFIISVHVEDPSEKVRAHLQEENLLLILIKCVDEWRWNSLATLRIRNLIALLAKTLQYLVGGFEKRDQVKKYLCNRYHITKEEDPKKLTATPLDYYVFREDLLARYPTSIPPPSTLPENFENTSSLSQFLNIPRTLESNKMNANLPAPSVHISTPAPSPPSTPISKPTKTKKYYQVNQSYPFIFPNSEELNSVPKSIQEATELCSSRVQEKLSLKQLWSERDNFMKQERGWTDALEMSDDLFDNYSKSSKDEDASYISSLAIIEKFYEDSLPYLSSLVHVILQVVISSTENNQILGDENMSFKDVSFLEMIRVKEIALKQSSYTLMLLLKWFKVSHILKFEYLGTLIYDSNYFAIMTQYLKSIGESAHARITNNILYKCNQDFWSYAAEISKKNYNVTRLEESIDSTFCFNLTGILTVGALISRKKTQRVISLSEKDLARLLKPFFLMINNALWKPILKLVKDITPFNGRKWKSHNMDLISMVYLHMKPQLRDNWLSGRDLDSELKDAYGQEIALRAIIQFYNMRKYGDRMNELGYRKRETDFFTREMELVAASEQ